MITQLGKAVDYVKRNQNTQDIGALIVRASKCYHVNYRDIRRELGLK